MTVSVVIPEGKNVFETVQSIVGQSYRDLEIAVVGRGGKVRLHDVKDNRLLFVKPAGNRRNDGVSCTGGEYIIVVNSGDVLERNGILWMLGAFGAANRPDLVYSDFYLMPEEGAIKPVRLPVWNGKPDVLKRCLPVSYMITRRLWAALDGWKTGGGSQIDFDFWLRAWTWGARFGRIQKCLYGQRAEASDWVRFAHARAVEKACSNLR